MLVFCLLEMNVESLRKTLWYVGALWMDPPKFGCVHGLCSYIGLLTSDDCIVRAHTMQTDTGHTFYEFPLLPKDPVAYRPSAFSASYAIQ